VVEKDKRLSTKRHARKNYGDKKNAVSYRVRPEPHPNLWNGGELRDEQNLQILPVALWL
jgi:hypothetical protein